MKKTVFFFTLLISSVVFSQVSVATSTPEPSNKWTFGGGLGVSFGSNSAFGLQISPRAGYRLTNDLEVGALGSVTWQRSDYHNSTLFGIGPFINYYFVRSFYVGANFQEYFYNYHNKVYDYKYNGNETALYLGGGYMQQVGTNSYVQIGLMYNVLWKENSSILSSGLYPTIGFVVGL